MLLPISKNFGESNHVALVGTEMAKNFKHVWNVCKLWPNFRRKGSLARTQRMELDVPQSVTIAKNKPRVFIKFWFAYFQSIFL